MLVGGVGGYMGEWAPTGTQLAPIGISLPPLWLPKPYALRTYADICCT